MNDLLDRIPHQPPFRLLDAVTESSPDSLAATATARSADPFWAGIFAAHYPGNPIVPGVLLCEMALQAGACLMAGRDGIAGGIPVVARIRDAKFRRPVRPDEPLVVSVILTEQVGPAHYMKGKVSASGEAALAVEFVVTVAGVLPMHTDTGAKVERAEHSRSGSSRGR